MDVANVEDAQTHGDAEQPSVGSLASNIQSVDLNDDSTEATEQPSSQNKMKTIDEIKEQLQRQEGSSVSFVIIGS